MDNIHLNINLKKDSILVCITTFKSKGFDAHGISIRAYSHKDEKLGHMLYSSGNSKSKHNQLNNTAYIGFNAYSAIVPWEYFNGEIAMKDINYYLTNYKV